MDPPAKRSRRSVRVTSAPSATPEPPEPPEPRRQRRVPKKLDQGSSADEPKPELKPELKPAADVWPQPKPRWVVPRHLDVSLARGVPPPAPRFAQPLDPRATNETLFRYLLADAIAHGPGVVSDIQAVRAYERAVRDPAERAAMAARNDAQEVAARFDVELADARLKKWIHDNSYPDSAANYAKSMPLTKTRSTAHPFSL